MTKDSEVLASPEGTATEGNPISQSTPEKGGLVKAGLRRVAGGVAAVKSRFGRIKTEPTASATSTPASIAEASGSPSIAPATASGTEAEKISEPDVVFSEQSLFPSKEASTPDFVQQTESGVENNGTHAEVISESGDNVPAEPVAVTVEEPPASEYDALIFKNEPEEKEVSSGAGKPIGTSIASVAVELSETSSGNTSDESVPEISAGKLIKRQSLLERAGARVRGLLKGSDVKAGPPPLVPMTEVTDPAPVNKLAPLAESAQIDKQGKAESQDLTDDPKPPTIVREHVKKALDEPIRDIVLDRIR